MYTGSYKAIYRTFIATAAAEAADKEGNVTGYEHNLF
jgi:hypothetical protein